MEDSYETGKADLKGADGRSGGMGTCRAGAPDDHIPSQAGCGMWAAGGAWCIGMAFVAYVPSSGYCAGYGCRACRTPYSGVGNEAVSGNGDHIGGVYDTVSIYSSHWYGTGNVWNEDFGIYAAEASPVYDYT